MATYQELLLSDEWRSYRLIVIERDAKTCLNCRNEIYTANFDGSTGNVSIDTYKNQKVWIDNSKVSVNLYKTSVEIGECFCYFDKREDANYTVHAIRNRTDREKYISNLKLQEDFLNGTLLTELFGIVGPVPSESEIKSYFTKSKRLDSVSVPPQSAIDTFKWRYVRNLHVHHIYYQYGLLPWQYPINSLQTLCWSCHETLHKNGKIPVYDQTGSITNDIFLTACAKCYGAGWFPQYKNVEYGVCFRCHGAKYEELIEK